MFPHWGDNVVYILSEVLAIKNFEVNLTGEVKEKMLASPVEELRGMLHKGHFLPTFPFPSFVYKPQIIQELYMNLTRSHQEKCKASQNFQEILNRLVFEQQSVYHLSFSPSEKLTEISKLRDWET